MYIMIGATVICLIISFIADRKKTFQGLKKGVMKLLRILPFLGVILIGVTLALYLIPERYISKVLTHNNQLKAFVSAVALGSISTMPGFIAFPLGGLLREQGVPFFLLSAFTTTLMMVGVTSLPFEKKFLGMKVAVLRNVAGLVTAVVVALVTGFVFGEFK